MLLFSESHAITCQMYASQFENSLIQYLFFLASLIVKG